MLACSRDPELWFSEHPAELERAKTLCGDCPIRRQCLNEALDRAEPWGVWGGEIIEGGAVLARKRPRGRPRKDQIAAYPLRSVRRVCTDYRRRIPQVVMPAQS